MTSNIGIHTGSGAPAASWGPTRHRTSAHLAPRQGWRAASDGRRALAILAPLFVGAMILPGEGPSRSDESSVALAAMLLQLLLVPMLHALARILRPYHSVGPPREAVARHWLAAVAVAFGAVPIAMFTTDAPLISFLSAFIALLALLLGLVTLVWGLFAVGLRT